MAAEKGFCLWFTGLSGSGKTTITNVLVKEMRKRGSKLEVLDGDIVRQNLSKGLGFSQGGPRHQHPPGRVRRRRSWRATRFR